MSTPSAETATPIISTDELQAYYPLHENTQDQSGNNTQSTSSKINFDPKASSVGVAGFTRSGAYMMPTYSSITDAPNFSLAGWMYTDSYDSIDGPDYDYGTAFGWLSIERPSGKLMFSYLWATGVETVKTTSPLPIGEWTHVSVTYKRSENIIRIYINGVLDKEYSPTLFQPNTPPTTPPPAASPADSPIGGPKYGAANTYSTLNGYLCELYLLTRQITQEEVGTLANQNWGQKGWLGDRKVPNVEIPNQNGHTPGSVVFKDKIYCFYEGSSENSLKLTYTTFDGATWSDDISVPETSMKGSPSAVVFNNKLYCFYSGGAPGWMPLFYSVFDGENWEGAQIASKNFALESSAVVFNDKLYCFHEGTGRDGRLWYNIYDGYQWSDDIMITTTYITAGPSAMVYNNQIYCFHQGAGEMESILRYNIFDGEQWSENLTVPDAITSFSPSALLFKGEIYCFFNSYTPALNTELAYSVFDGEQWSAKELVPNTEPGLSPSAVRYQDKIYCFYPGSELNKELHYNVYIPQLNDPAS